MCATHEHGSGRAVGADRLETDRADLLVVDPYCLSGVAVADLSFRPNDLKHLPDLGRGERGPAGIDQRSRGQEGRGPFVLAAHDEEVQRHLGLVNETDARQLTGLDLGVLGESARRDQDKQEQTQAFSHTYPIGHPALQL